MEPLFKLSLKFIERWQRNGVTHEGASAIFLRVMEAYGHHTRGYHGAGHILNLDREFEWAKVLANDADAVWDAMIWHDYHMSFRAEAKDNEERSFRAFKEHTASFNVATDHTEKVGRIIVRGTKHLGGLTDTDEQLMADMDLAGFGYPWPVVLEASRGIRHEYRQYSQDDYVAGRRAVLKMFLERGRNIYYLPMFKDEYGERALRNLECEIDMLPELVQRFDSGH